MTLLEFIQNYPKFAEASGLNPNPLDKNHAYDYLGWVMSGGEFPTNGGHFSSEFKMPWHPNRFPEETKQGRMIMDSISGEMIPKYKAEFIRNLYRGFLGE